MPLKGINIIKSSLLLLLFSAFLSSCATTVVHLDRLEKNEPFIYYGGTRSDFAGLGDFLSGNSNGNGLELFLIVDIPLSFVADTILFPYYLFSSHGKELYTSEYIMAEALHKSGNYDEARKAYEASAHNQHPLAIFRLGTYYLEGIGVEKDINKAYLYFESAAKYNVKGAYNNLILLNYEGSYIPRDLVQSYKWLYISHNGIIDDSQRWKNILESEMNIEDIEHAKTLGQKWLEENKPL